MIQQPGDSAVPPEPVTEPDPVDGVIERRDAVLLALLPEVPFDGWCRSSLIRAGAAAGLPAGEVLAAFPDGMGQAISHFNHWADRQMLAALAGQNLPAMKVRQRITLAVRTRLEILTPHKEAVRRSLALLALPQHAGLAPKLLYRTVDAMWLAAGDTSTDYNFYTKRLLLAGVQSAMLLYWLEDRSPGQADSWTFLDRRIENIMQLGQGIAKVKKLVDLVDHLPSPLRMMQRLRGKAA